MGLKVWSRLALPLGKLNVQMFRSSYKDFGVLEGKAELLRILQRLKSPIQGVSWPAFNLPRLLEVGSKLGYSPVPQQP